MSFKQLIILSSAAVFLFFCVFTFVLVSSSLEKRKINEDSKKVVSLWGTYDYKTFPAEYFAKLKPYYSKSYYDSMAEDKQSVGMRTANLKRYLYSFSATPKKVEQTKKVNDQYLVKISAKITTSRVKKDGKEEKEEKTETVNITWKKENNKYKVTSVESD